MNLLVFVVSKEDKLDSFGNVNSVSIGMKGSLILSSGSDCKSISADKWQSFSVEKEKKLEGC